MGERRFVIREYYSDEQTTGYSETSITKAEFENLFMLAYRKFTTDERFNAEDAINIFVHREGNKGEENTEPAGVSYRVDAQPSPTPTKDEIWEWAERVAELIIPEDGLLRQKLEIALASIPCIQKE